MEKRITAKASNQKLVNVFFLQCLLKNKNKKKLTMQDGLVKR